MALKKQPFKEYLKSNWAQITCAFGMFFWIITAIYDVKSTVKDVKSEISELRVLTAKDKEIIEDKVLTEEEKKQLKYQELLPTDWYFVRQIETGIEVPAEILLQRTEIRNKYK